MAPETLTVEQLETSLASLYADRGGVIGICGFPGAGKTTLGKRLKDYFGERALAVPVDDFCVRETPVRKAFLTEALKTGDQDRLAYLARPDRHEENPYANPVTWYDWEAAADTLRRLKKGESVTRTGAWTQTTGLCDRTQIYTPPAHEHPLYFVDCVYLFEKPLRREIDRHVLVDRSRQEANVREVARDSHRHDDVYLGYKRLVTRNYCAPYLARHRQDMNFIVF